MKAMIFAAGLGTRLKPFTDKHPKALAKVNGKTLLELSVRYLQKYGINDIVVNVHHFADQIEAEIDYHNGYGSTITISDERDEVLETGGGLLKAANHFRNEECFVVMNVDVLTDLDLGEMIDVHRHSDAIATLAIQSRKSSRSLLFNDKMELCGWTNNNTGEEKIVRESKALTFFAFSGIQVVSPEIFDMPFEGKFSIIDVYLHYAKTRLIFGFDDYEGIFLDVGKPESIAEASEVLHDIENNEITKNTLPDELKYIARDSSYHSGECQISDIKSIGFNITATLTWKNISWELTIENCLDYKFTQRQSDVGIKVCMYHPLLYIHNDGISELYFNGKPKDVNGYLADICNAHSIICGKWMGLDKYIYAYKYPWDTLDYMFQLYTAGIDKYVYLDKKHGDTEDSMFGLYAVGPHSIIEKYKAVLDAHDMKSSILRSSPKPSSHMKILLSGDSYFIGQDFIFKKIDT